MIAACQRRLQAAAHHIAALAGACRWSGDWPPPLHVLRLQAEACAYGALLALVVAGLLVAQRQRSATLPGQTIRHRSRSPRATSSLISNPAMMVLPAPGSSASKKRSG